MGLFRKKKVEAEVPEKKIKTEHKCSFKDFPCYIEYSYDGNTHEYEVSVIEPYVCIYCKKRENVTIENWNGTSNNPEKQVNKLITKIKEENPDLIKPKLVVEDMVADFQRVNKEDQKWYDFLHGRGEIDNEINLKL